MKSAKWLKIDFYVKKVSVQTIGAMWLYQKYAKQGYTSSHTFAGSDEYIQEAPYLLDSKGELFIYG